MGKKKLKKEKKKLLEKREETPANTDSSKLLEGKSQLKR